MIGCVYIAFPSVKANQLLQGRWIRYTVSRNYRLSCISLMQLRAAAFAQSERHDLQKGQARPRRMVPADVAWLVPKQSVVPTVAQVFKEEADSY